MSGFTPLIRDQFRSILTTQFQQSLTQVGILLADVPDTSPGTIMGSVFDAVSLVAVQQQQQDIDVQNASRLATIPANADGTPNSDVDSYVAPFGFKRIDGSFSTSQTFSLNVTSPSSSPITVPTGLIFLRGDGVPFVLVDDVTQAAYNGAHGYTIPAMTSSVLATATCLQVGSIGATAANSAWSIYSGPGTPTAPGLGSISNAYPITSGGNIETDGALIARFTLGMQNGKWATITAIQSAALGSQNSLIYSYGDHVNADGSYHAAYFTLVVNVAGSFTVPSSAVITAVQIAVNAVRAGGIEFEVIAPTLVTPTITGNIAVRAGYVSATVKAAVQAAVQSYGNGIGLEPNGGTTTFAYASLVATIVAVPGVNPIGTNVTVNSGTADVNAPFASQIVIPTPPSFTTS